jgi:hypothetical protein
LGLGKYHNILYEAATYGEECKALNDFVQASQA